MLFCAREGLSESRALSSVDYFIVVLRHRQPPDDQEEEEILQMTRSTCLGGRLEGALHCTNADSFRCIKLSRKPQLD